MVKTNDQLRERNKVESYKRTVDASDDWWESKLKLQQVIKHGHLLLVHSVVIFFEDVDNEIPEENEEENMRNDVHILNDVHIDGNSQKRKTSEISTSHFKTERKNPQSKLKRLQNCP
ncbi:hypothetical protein Goklo_000892, partial [Gossypium klotzschianum]|nr:hypothetical protein [Gossypium klotzschianum]